MIGKERHAIGHAVFVTRKNLVKNGAIKLLILTVLLGSTVAIGSEYSPYPTKIQPSAETKAPRPDPSFSMVGNAALFVPEPIYSPSEEKEPYPMKRAIVGYIGYFAGMLLLVSHPQRP